MIVRELFIDKNKCNGDKCTCPYRCYDHFSNLFQLDKTANVAKVKDDAVPVPVEFIPEAEWAIFRCWEQDGPGAGSILGRGEPETPEPPTGE